MLSHRRKDFAYRVRDQVSLQVKSKSVGHAGSLSSAPPESADTIRPTPRPPVLRNRLSKPLPLVPGRLAGGEPFCGCQGCGEGGDLVGVGCGETRQDFTQVSAHVYSHAFAALHNADNGGHCRCRSGGSDVQPVLSPKGDGPYTLLAAVVINFGHAVFQAAPQLGAQLQGVAAGSGQRAAGQQVFIKRGGVKLRD